MNSIYSIISRSFRSLILIRLYSYSNITFLRHAQSIYNVGSSQFIQKHNITNLTWNQICQLDQYNEQINYNKKYIDCDLSQNGLLQCHQLQQMYLSINKIQYDLVLVSPLMRALNTCRKVFHKFNLKVIVLPELTEALRYACDISHYIKQKKLQFKQFDFSLINQNNNLWFLQTQPIQTRQLILNRLNQKNLLNQNKHYPQIQSQILSLMQSNILFQSDYHVRKRSNKIKQILSSYQNQYKYKNIIVISHHYMIQSILAKGYKDNNQPIVQNDQEVPNAKPYKVGLDEILKIK